jgi:hypothetical protein
MMRAILRFNRALAQPRRSAAHPGHPHFIRAGAHCVGRRFNSRAGPTRL